MGTPSGGGEVLRAMMPHAKASSWAVWADDDVALPPSWGELHGRCVVVAMNPAGRAVDLSAPDWSMFHTGRSHNDHLLASALRDTPAWGGFMTILHPNILDSDEARARICVSEARMAARTLLGQLTALDALDGVIICLGGTVHRHLTADPEMFEGNRFVTVPHYSRGNARAHGNDAERYRALVHEALEPVLA